MARYTEAVNGYLDLLTGGRSLRLPGLSADAGRSADRAAVGLRGREAPGGVGRRRASRVALELAERQFRKGSKDQAQATLTQAWGQANVELPLLASLWPGVVDEVSYHALLRGMSDMARLSELLATGKNPLGYSPGWVPIHYNPGVDLNNYQQTNALAGEKLVSAEYFRGRGGGQVAARHRPLRDDADPLQRDPHRRYNERLVALCGGSVQEPDTSRCDGGDDRRPDLVGRSSPAPPQPGTGADERTQQAHRHRGRGQGQGGRTDHAYGHLGESRHQRKVQLAHGPGQGHLQRLEDRQGHWRRVVGYDHRGEGRCGLWALWWGRRRSSLAAWVPAWT